MALLYITVGEVSHDGDAEYVLEDIAKSGGQCANYSLSVSHDSARFAIQVSDFKTFLTKFKQTDSGGFM